MELLRLPKTMLNWFAKRDAGEPAPAPSPPENQIPAPDWFDSLPETFEGDRSVKQSFVCRWCLNPAFQVPRSAHDYIQLRAVLMIPDRVKDPPICNSCFESAVFGFNRHVTNIGTRNDGHTNLALARSAG